MVEIGRACIDTDYRRNAALIALLWSGLGRYTQAGGHRYRLGCASVSLADGGHNAATLFSSLRTACSPGCACRRSA